MGNKSARSKQVIKGLKNGTLLTQLQGIAVQLGVTVRFEKGDFKSAGCRVDEQNIIFIKKTDTESIQIETLLGELAKLNFETINIHPAIREYLTLKQKDDTSRSVVQEEPS